MCIEVFVLTRENVTEQKNKGNVQKPQRPGPRGSRLITMASMAEGFGRELGAENRPLYGEIMQTLIPPALRKTILGHFELSHASTTILGLVHLFIFYVFHLMKPKRGPRIVVFGL